MATSFELTYAAAGGGHSPVDLDVSVDREGRVRVYAGTSYSIPLERLNRVGVFEGAAPDGALSSLSTHLRAVAVAADGRGGGDGAPPGSPWRSLRFSVDGAERALDLSGASNGPEVDALEAAIQRVALELTDQPASALEATLAVARDGAQVTAAVEVRVVGVRPLRAVFLGDTDGDVTASAQVRFEERLVLPSGAAMPMPLTTAALTPAEMRNLELPVGVVDAAPGATYRVPCGAVDVPRGDNVVAFGQLDLWLEDGGRRRAVRLLTPDTPVA